MKIMGIDEAGRGSIIGPMVICGAMTDTNNIKELKKLGVKDSKMLNPKKREFLEKHIKKLCSTNLRVIKAEEIDMNMNSGINLNQIEALNMAKIINKLRPDKVIIDALNGKKKFLDFMKKFLEYEPKMVLEHKADEKYPIVSSASIVAKVMRDKELKKIEKKTGIELGVGYPHDETCINSLRQNMCNKELMKHVRRKWSTYSRIREEVEQTGLVDYD